MTSGEPFTQEPVNPLLTEADKIPIINFLAEKRKGLGQKPEDQRVLRGINAAMMEIKQGKTGRAENLLDYFLERCQQLTGPFRSDDVVGDRLALSAVAEAERIINFFETINPAKAGELRNEWKHTESQITPWYMK